MAWHMKTQDLPKLRGAREVERGIPCSTESPTEIEDVFLDGLGLPRGNPLGGLLLGYSSNFQKVGYSDDDAISIVESIYSD